MPPSLTWRRTVAAAHDAGAEPVADTVPVADTMLVAGTRAVLS